MGLPLCVGNGRRILSWLCVAFSTLVITYNIKGFGNGHIQLHERSGIHKTSCIDFTGFKLKHCEYMEYEQMMANFTEHQNVSVNVQIGEAPVNQSIRNIRYKQVAFLKIHKAGSSTAQNIFLRYGYSRNLLFVLSKVRKEQYDNVISLSSSLNENNTIAPPINKTFDVLCNHVLYNREAFQKYIPGNTAYIGIVREPFEMFLSTLNYFRPEYIFKTIKAITPVLNYLVDPWKYEKGLPLTYSLTNNRMALEFDFPKHLFKTYSKEESEAYLSKLDQEFHFVIIMEYFAESVVMMRRILGWSIKDVLYVKKNSAKKYSFVDNTYRYLYQRFAKLDYDLYNFYYIKLWEKIKLEGIDFQLELSFFQNLRKAVEDYCIKHKQTVLPYHVPDSKWSTAFNVTRKDCDLLLLNEMKFVSLIRQRQQTNTTNQK
ncbi:GAL3ST1 [Mytilus edulis]|uniref:GAL3ST1 n=2 Tax=Mytilus TaxID=6548 RepID=A0A8S3VC04_MYTED|nr:GAL3ST1 [Mytilus edulis]